MEPSVSPNPDPDAHIVAMIDLLLTIGYIDGLLHEGEQKFIKQYLDRLAEHVAQPPDTADALRARIDAGYARLDSEIAAVAAEVVAAGDDKYMKTRLKVRAVALFRAFSPADQVTALELLNLVMQTDGTISPEERELHDELVAHFQAAPQIVAPVEPGAPEPMRIDAPQTVKLETFTHPALDLLEQRYASDPEALTTQLTGDYDLIFQAITAWEKQRSRGNGRLLGFSNVSQFTPGTRFLDGHVHVQVPDRPTELIVLGDLHGCYSCLKAALLQSSFIERARKHQQDPVNQPDVKLVLLGDYIDRGRFSFEGVLRAALQLFVMFPDHVVLLRGNHEFLMRIEDRIVSAVTPAEALPALAERAPADVLEAYRHLFDRMPSSFLFERTLFVHGGIARDETLVERFRDLSSLNDSVLRFEMMWADPVATDYVPVALQRESPRFSFGRDQFSAFMRHVGCDTLIRGHEQVDAGFTTVFDLGHCRLHTLFSAGGHDNADLPKDSRYRTVTPMALTIHAGAGPSHAVPWAIEYKKFTTAAYNGLYSTTGGAERRKTMRL